MNEEIKNILNSIDFNNNKLVKINNNLFLTNNQIELLRRYNIYPIELEEVICKCKYVKECTIVAVKHKVKQEAVKAVIVLKKDIEKTNDVEREIKEYCKKNIAKYAIPYEYEFRESLPITRVGKINYRELERK